ncbi:hypothetical protein FIBSPDRAFT_887992 [Athelia psychrophila]|uniref:Uncharacterized protein n=1 Tax=Athelia psychrophila TaxID=1759441 RepID=A0A166NX97_9AGAM|nr:hypothetical protein FIBSPDRAFT_887992 [Fibularhizoctonia sp. CBS 109695]
MNSWHCILQKQNKSMKAKENKKNDDCTKLLPKGMGRHLTEAGFIQAVRDKETEKQQKLDEKEGRKDLPKKPTRPKKPKHTADGPIVGFDQSDEEGMSSSDNEDGDED